MAGVAPGSPPPDHQAMSLSVAGVTTPWLLATILFVYSEIEPWMMTLPPIIWLSIIVPPLMTARLTGAEGGPILITGLGVGVEVAVTLGSGDANGVGVTRVRGAGGRGAATRDITPATTTATNTATTALRASRYITLAHERQVLPHY